MGDPNLMDKSLRSVFVGNIPYEATEEKLKDIFCEVGPVLSFKLVYDRETGKPKGYGFCEYKDQETALSAMRNLNGYEIGGRTLRVDNACTEKSRMEMQSLLQGPVVENPYGDPVDPEKAPETISKAVASLPPEQMFELMKQMKLCIQNNPSEARTMLLQNPQLAYALLQAQVVMRIVDPQVAVTMLHKKNIAPPPLQMNPDAGSNSTPPVVTSVTTPASAAPNIASIANSMAPAFIMTGRDEGWKQAAVPTPVPPPSQLARQALSADRQTLMGDRQGLLGDRPLVPPPANREPAPQLPPPVPVNPVFGASQDLDLRSLSGPPRMPLRVTDQDLRIPPGGPMPSGPPRDMHDHRPDPRDFRPDQRGPPMVPDPRGPPQMVPDPRGPPGGQRGPPMGQDFDHYPRDPRGPLPPDRFQRDPRDMRDRDMRDPRERSFDRPDPRGDPRGHGPPHPVPPPHRMPPPLQQGPDIGMRGGLSPNSAPGASDQEKAALIMQVLQLSDEQIAVLPLEQRQSILVLKEQIAKSTHPPQH